MPHHRARFTALGGWDVARHVIEEGETFARAAGPGGRLDVDRLGVGAPLAGRHTGGPGVAGVSAGALQPPSLLARPGVRPGGRRDLCAAGEDGLVASAAR